MKLRADVQPSDFKHAPKLILLAGETAVKVVPVSPLACLLTVEIVAAICASIGHIYGALSRSQNAKTSDIEALHPRHQGALLRQEPLDGRKKHKLATANPD